MNPQFVVVGTGRCGTHYAASLLTAAGLYCTHELLVTWTPGIVPDINVDRWSQHGARADSSWQLSNFLTHHTLRNSTIIHVIRDPVKVANSFVRVGFFESGSPSRWDEAWLWQQYPTINNCSDQSSRIFEYWNRCNSRIIDNIGGRRYIRHIIGQDTDAELLCKLDITSQVEPQKQWYNYIKEADVNVNLSSNEYNMSIDLAHQYGIKI